MYIIIYINERTMNSPETKFEQILGGFTQIEPILVNGFPNRPIRKRRNKNPVWKVFSPLIRTGHKKESSLEYFFTLVQGRKIIYSRITDMPLCTVPNKVMLSSS